jgi:hypothetical protein
LENMQTGSDSLLVSGLELKVDGSDDCCKGLGPAAGEGTDGGDITPME